LVGNIQAEKHMDATIFSDVHPTFESISTQEALNRLKISDGKLEIMPESTSAVNDRNIWLLAQSDSKITSISPSYNRQHTLRFTITIAIVRVANKSISANGKVMNILCGFQLQY
jgi:hypothetical protein